MQNINTTGKEVSLDASNNWKATFDNLRKFKADGTEIKYTIKEDVPSGYEDNVSGSHDKGYIITNTNVEKISIPVTKKWVGKPTDKLEVKLLADGVEKEKVTLTSTTNWKHTFNNLPKYDYKDGH